MLSTLALRSSPPPSARPREIRKQRRIVRGKFRAPREGLEMFVQGEEKAVSSGVLWGWRGAVAYFTALRHVRKGCA